jgi:ACS family glucarate transporter-like MFS transporter
VTNIEVGSHDFGTSAPPTRVRWNILFLVMAATGLTYLDRVNLSIAGHSIESEMHFSTVTMGWVFSAFLLGYALMQVPGGWAADRFGPRRVLALAILWWSAFTVLTGLVPGLALARWIGLVAAFMVVRFFVGVGEAACSPTNNKIVANWMGSHTRGLGTSFSILGIGLGGAITPPLIAWIMQRWGWRSSFYISGLIGVIFAAVWYFYVRNRPEEHPGVNEAELRRIVSQRSDRGGEQRQVLQPVPWGKLLRNRSVWGLLLGYFCQGYPIYFYYTWLFIYLVKVRGLTVEQGGAWGTLPYLSIALLAPFGGVFSDYAARRFGKTRGRRGAVWIGMFASALFLWLGGRAANSTAAILLLAAASGSNMFAATTFWATCIDLTEQFAGSLSGLMNMFGNLGGWLSPILTAYVASRFGWKQALDLAAIVTACAGFCFALVNAGRNLDRAGNWAEGASSQAE